MDTNVTITIPPFSFNVNLKEIRDYVKKAMPKLRLLMPADKDLWPWLACRAYADVCADMFTEGNAVGGWGKSHSRYVWQTLSSKVPEDAGGQDDSITTTATVVRNLAAMRDIPSLFNVDDIATSLREGVFSCTRQYVANRIDVNTGGVGTLSRLGLGDQVAAVNLRHTCSAVIIWSVVQGGAKHIRPAFDFIRQRIARLGQDIRGDSRPESLAPALDALIRIRDQFSEILPKDEQDSLASLILVVRSELRAQFNDKQAGWIFDPCGNSSKAW